MISRYDTIGSHSWIAKSLPDLRAQARHWLTAPPLTELVTALGGPTVEDTQQSFQQLAAWTAATLDTRRGAERHDAEQVQQFSTHADAIIGAAGELGLLGTADQRRHDYDCLVILGGTATGNRLRTELAATLLGHLRTRLIIGAASERRLSEAESAAEPGSAGFDVEWRDLRTRMMQLLDLRPAAVATEEETEARLLGYLRNHDTPVRLLVTPTVDQRRPTTHDQVRHLRELLPPPSRRRVLLVTSAIYAPYQFFAATTELLPDASHVELVGTPTSTIGHQGLLTQRLLQEVHSAVHAAVQLQRTVPDGDPR
jgi:hypothetical protein